MFKVFEKLMDTSMEAVEANICLEAPKYFPIEYADVADHPPTTNHHDVKSMDKVLSKILMWSRGAR